MPLPHNFQGRITRGTPAQNEQGVPQILGTWFELSFDPSGNGQLWGDVSHIRGYDGAIQFETMDGNTVRGFSFEYMDDNLDSSAYEFKPVTGTRVIGPTEGAGAAIQWAADDYCLLRVPDSEWVYCDDSHQSPVIVSPWGQQSLQATFFYHFL